jgi:hypothetical protein
MLEALSMTRDEFVALLETMAGGWNGNDPELVVSCFAEDIDYADPLRYQLHGREELRGFFELPEGGSQWVRWHSIIFDEHTQAGAAEYTYEEAQRYHGFVLVRVADGLVTHWREYQHTSDLDFEAFVSGEAR